ncbi:MAG: hypothetical protein NXI02_03100 [Rhodobacteraceae bacterium]|nr:hypothetical protein [Paracoccaceae bacterium]
MAERSEINANLMNTFYAAAMTQPMAVDQESPTIKELSELAGVNYRTLSRNLRYLTYRDRKNKPGLDFVIVETNPDNRREKRVFLTDKGEQLREDILLLIG